MWTLPRLWLLDEKLCKSGAEGLDSSGNRLQAPLEPFEKTIKTACFLGFSVSFKILRCGKWALQDSNL
jgi:hypothetical protein